MINEAVQAPWHVDSVEYILLKQFPYHVWPHECSVVEANSVFNPISAIPFNHVAAFICFLASDSFTGVQPRQAS